MIRYAPAFGLRTDAVPELDPDTVTPGVIGFFAIFFVAAAVVLLMVDMTRRIRRTRYRAEVAERLDAEEAAIADTERVEAERAEDDRVIRPLDFEAGGDDRSSGGRPDR